MPFYRISAHYAVQARQIGFCARLATLIFLIIGHRPARYVPSPPQAARSVVPACNTRPLLTRLWRHSVTTFRLIACCTPLNIRATLH